MAKTHKPTEGEWTQEYDGTVCMAGQGVIETDWLAPDGRDFEERMANGRTICAAKPALEALRMFMAQYGTGIGRENRPEVIAARKALDIADGK